MGAKKTFDLNLIKTYIEDGLSLEKIAKKVNSSRRSITGTLETCQYYKKYFSNVGFITKKIKILL